MKTVDEYIDLAEQAIEQSGRCVNSDAMQAHSRRAQVLLNLANFSRTHMPVESNDAPDSSGDSKPTGTAQFPGIHPA